MTSKPRPQRRTLLAEPDEALLGYLQTLLDEVPDEPETVTVEPPVAPTVMPAPPLSRARTETALPDVVVAVKTESDTERQTVTPAAASEVQASAAPIDENMPLPEWAGEAFQALDFEAAGGQFSLRLLDMKAIVPLEGTLTRLPGHPDWHRGVMRVRGEKVGVVDLARLLHGPAADPEGDAAAYLLILDDGRWGLTCRRLGNARRVEPDEVRWRRNRAGPRFVRGVLRGTMTPLLHGEEIVDALDNPGPRRPAPDGL